MMRLTIGLVLLLAAPAAAQQSHVLIVSGLSGEPRFAQQYAEWTGQLADAAVKRFGVPRTNVTVLTETGEGAAKSTRANVLAALQRLGARAGADDDVAIVLFGHGSETGGQARLNLTGPDLTAADLAVALEAVPARRITVVNTASASGAFLKPLAAQNRIVITSTKSGAEQNETVFAGHFVSALAGDGADADKDGRVSMFEAFDYARREVERAYTSTQRLQTEHALLDADGDGVGSPAPTASNSDGAAAALVFLGRPAVAADAPASAELRALYAEKARLEAALDALRKRKDQMPDADYQRELEKLLLDLSRNGQAIRQREGGR